MRIAIVGTTGSGKTTLAQQIAAAFGLSHIELDALHWGPGWQALTTSDPATFIDHVQSAIAADAWVADGNYSLVRDAIWQRATHVIWLDYPRVVVMQRVIWRSLLRSLGRTKLWGGNRENWRGWLDGDHPIYWAWRTWSKRRAETKALLGRADYAYLSVIRLRHPRGAADVITRLRHDQGRAIARPK